jgi:hypothetical protein
MNPYLAGGLFVDYLIRGRHRLVPKHPQVLGPENLAALTAPAAFHENAASAETQDSGAVPFVGLTVSLQGTQTGLGEIKGAHE